MVDTADVQISGRFGQDNNYNCRSLLIQVYFQLNIFDIYFYLYYMKNDLQSPYVENVICIDK